MIKYRYSLFQDIKAHIELLLIWRWLKENNIIVHRPNPLATIKLWFKRPQVNFQVEKDITCYWVSAGTGGSYFPPDKIWICPRQKFPSLPDIIRHEITHIIYNDDVQNMTHQEKEAYIISKEKKHNLFLISRNP